MQIRTRITLPAEAFGLICPAPTQVSKHLANLGLTLSWSMPETYYPKAGGDSRPIIQPAHYHYKDRQGMEVIYLAGQDHAEEGEPGLPQHACRWWIYPGASIEAHNRIKQALSVRYHLDFVAIK